MNPALNRLFRQFPTPSRNVLAICIYGVGVGVSAVAFQIGFGWVYQNGIQRLSHESFGTFLLGSLVVLVSTALIVGGF